MSAIASDQVYLMKMAVMWYLVEHIPEVRLMSRAEIQAMLKQCDELSLRNPLHIIRERKFIVEAFDYEAKFSGLGVVSLMVAGIWVLQGEVREMCGSLVESWPINDALMLCQPRSIRSRISKTKYLEMQEEEKQAHLQRLDDFLAKFD